MNGHEVNYVNFTLRFYSSKKQMRIKTWYEEKTEYIPGLKKNTLLLCTFLYTLSMVEFDGLPASILST